MIQLIRTNAKHSDFIQLVKQLDADLAIRDGEDHDFYHQFNGLEDIKYVIVAFQNEQAIACGAIKQFDSTRVEVKRMFTAPEGRKQGIAITILTALEKWAKELSYSACILETGIKQPEAIALYKKCNYQIIPNYGQYKGVNTSICFEKQIG